MDALIAALANWNQTDAKGGTPLFIAAKNGHIDVVNALITAKADVNKALTTDGCTPLCIAAQNGHKDVVDALIVAKADGNKARIDGGNGKRTPHNVASNEGRREIVALLEDAGFWQ